MNNYTRTPRASRRSKKAGLRRTLLVVCMMLVVMVGSIAGTVAWLTATSGEVTNTFTIGDITIDLKEHKLNADGTLSTESVTEQEYKIVPGGTYNKDPFVTVNEGSENCWIYVSIENQLGIASYNIDTTTAWTLVGQKDSTKVYRYNTEMKAGESATVFTTVEIADDVTKDTFAQIGTKTIVLKAFAHQSANTDQATADKAAIAQFQVEAVTSAN